MTVPENIDPTKRDEGTFISLDDSRGKGSPKEDRDEEYQVICKSERSEITKTQPGHCGGLSNCKLPLFPNGAEVFEPRIITEATNKLRSRVQPVQHSSRIYRRTTVESNEQVPDHLKTTRVENSIYLSTAKLKENEKFEKISDEPARRRGCKGFIKDHSISENNCSIHKLPPNPDCKPHAARFQHAKQYSGRCSVTPKYKKLTENRLGNFVKLLWITCVLWLLVLRISMFINDCALTLSFLSYRWTRRVKGIAQKTSLKTSHAILLNIHVIAEACTYAFNDKQGLKDDTSKILPFLVEKDEKFDVSTYFKQINSKCGRTLLRNLFSLDSYSFLVNISVFPVYRKVLDDILPTFNTNRPPGPRESMVYELLRLCSLHRFPTTSSSPSLIRLASAGFYYLPNSGDEVVCYSCGARHSGWRAGDDPMNIHRHLSPGCAFITGNNSRNVPVNRSEELNSNQSVNRLSGIIQTHEREVRPSSPLPEGNLERLSERLPATSLTEEQFQGSNLESPDDRLSAPRLEARPREAAQAVNPSLHVSMESRHSLTNAPPDENTRHGGSSAQLLPGQQVPQARSSIMSANTELGIGTDRPRHPEYAVKVVRISSFNGWPAYIRQEPQELAEAGLYYAGFGDCVRCFFCGIGLKHWDPEDSPCVEHARWSPRCQYLRQLKGEDFIQLVQMSAESPMNNSPRENVPGPHVLTETSSAAAGISGNLELRDPGSLLRTDAAQSVIEMGYQPKCVKTAVETVLKNQGWEHLNAATVMEEIFAMEERGENVSVTRPQRERVRRGNQVHSVGVSAERVAKSSPNVVHVSEDPKKEKDDVNTKSLIDENRQLKEQALCKICLDNPVSIVFLPCGHLVCCPECAPALRKCPICREFIKGTVRTFLS